MKDKISEVLKKYEHKPLTDKNNRSMKKKETLFDILLKVSELRMDIETAEKRILRLFNVSVAKRKVCPQCKREFDHTEVPSGIFCCYACEYGY